MLCPTSTTVGGQRLGMLASASQGYGGQAVNDESPGIQRDDHSFAGLRRAKPSPRLTLCVISDLTKGPWKFKVSA